MPAGFHRKMMAPRLRVLHAIHDFLPRHQAGSEIYSADLAKALQRRGHHVTVLTATYEPTRSNGEVIWRVHDGLPVAEVVNNWTSGSFAGAWAPADLNRVFAALLETIDPDVLHCHSLLNLSFDLPALARARGAAVVATLHDYTPMCPSGGQRIHKAEQHVCHVIEPERCARCFRQSPFQGQLVFGRALGRPGAGWLARSARLLRKRAPGLVSRVAAVSSHAPESLGPTPADISHRLDRAIAAFRLFDHISAPSSSIAGEFARLGFPSERMSISDYGFPSFRARPRSNHGGPLRVGFVGTFVWHKGVHVLLEATRQLPPGSIDVRLFGDPDTFPDYAAQIRKAASGLPVTLAGRFDRDQRASIYAQMDVLAVPSIWLENSPLVIHEAFMAGVPVVASRIGGIADLIEDGVNGLLVEPNAPVALAAALRELAGNRQRLHALSSAAPSVKSLEQDAERWEEVYRSVAARAQAAAS